MLLKYCVFQVFSGFISLGFGPSLTEHTQTDAPLQLAINGFAEEMPVYRSLAEGMLMVTSLREVN